ncbi:MAG TPA: hypothetical protein VLF41_03275 [Candidatus Nanoarchaeia archaeon]|nr:hypothetical protein [Candidatus Nanoarchaeia archaeon]
MAETNQTEIDADPQSWIKLLREARFKALLVPLGFLVVITGAYFLFRFTYKPAKSEIPQQNVDNLPGSAATLGQPGETLTVGANANFKGALQVAGDVNVAGKFNAANPVSLAGIDVAGNSKLSTAQLSSNLTVGGTSTLQGDVTAQKLLSVGGNLNVTGDGSFGGSLSGGQLNVRGASISGPLTVSGHYISSGATPGLSTGTAVGSGGSGSISGDDTSGTLLFNVGGGAPAGTFGTISFRQTYSSTPHVTLTPTSQASAGIQYYVSKNTGSFSVIVITPPIPGNAYSFDYFISQ